MQSGITIGSLEAVDLFFRFAAFGQIVLLLGLTLVRPASMRQWSLLAVAVCALAYLLLTAPVDDQYYGLWRPVLLTLTDAFAYAIWFVAMAYFNDSFSPRRWPLAVKLLLTTLALWHLVFFGLLGGNGLYHDLNHLLAIAVLVHLVFFILRGLEDDLIAQRRKHRMLLTAVTSVFAIMLAVVEFAPESFRHRPLVGVFNAGFILLATTLGARMLWMPRQAKPAQRPTARSGSNSLPPRLTALYERLQHFLEGGGYRQTGLGIKALSAQLDCQEYQLRHLINQHLGYNNFSAFLNHYRLREAAEKLADPAHAHTPILTLALELGYASIGPFNRAFKAQFDQTPSEYRLQFHNRP